jgi:hypothetical protein
MQQIFSYALKVNIWLGYDSQQMSGALLYLRRLALQSEDKNGRNTEALESLSEPEGTTYRDVASLARAAWWDRLWV